MINIIELTTLLNTKYLNHYKTQIVGGFDEPFYLAAKNGNNAEIQFSHDYIRSALHELAHWCTAGVERRNTDDYGYWYAADGRNQKQQDEFFKVEVIPQTYEWAFSQACGVEFEASVDNLHNATTGAKEFEQDLIKKKQCYINEGFPKRVSEIIQLLQDAKGEN